MRIVVVLCLWLMAIGAGVYCGIYASPDIEKRMNKDVVPKFEARPVVGAPTLGVVVGPRRVQSLEITCGQDVYRYDLVGDSADRVRVGFNIHYKKQVHTGLVALAYATKIAFYFLDIKVMLQNTFRAETVLSIKDPKVIVGVILGTIFGYGMGYSFGYSDPYSCEEEKDHSELTRATEVWHDMAQKYRDDAYVKARYPLLSHY